MKTIYFKGETAIAFGTIGTVQPGQKLTIESATADRLIAKGYFAEVVTQKPSKSKIDDKGE